MPPIECGGFFWSILYESEKQNAIQLDATYLSYSTVEALLPYGGIVRRHTREPTVLRYRPAGTLCAFVHGEAFIYILFVTFCFPSSVPVIINMDNM